MSKDDLSAEVARSLLRYDPDSGKLFWKERDITWFTSGRQSASHACARWNARYAGKEAFTSVAEGRAQGLIFGKRYRAHRVIWLILHGQWPPDQIDHINGDATDNRIVNLRPCTNAQNAMNRKPRPGSSRYLGVYFDRNAGAWMAGISVRRKFHFLGRFDNEIAAAKARDKASRKHFGEFANLNFPDTERATT